MVCGSYRRGKPQSGDVDILIAPRSGEDMLPPHSLLTVIESLSQSGFLTDHLSLPGDRTYQFSRERRKTTASADDDSQAVDSAVQHYRSSYMGVCKLPTADALHRRIDMKTYPRSMLPFATLYFTGSDHFNRSMRLYAKRRGFQLSDKHLVYREKIAYFAKEFGEHTLGEAIVCESEEDIFRALHLPYKPPTDRNVFDIEHLVSAADRDALQAAGPSKGKFMLLGHAESGDEVDSDSDEQGEQQV